MFVRAHVRSCVCVLISTCMCMCIACVRLRTCVYGCVRECVRA